ncbi:BING4CT-domain-containing protein [Violaceomyces palustris]|uniref:BING4CT-domain-containing protein n=1 Tax=Violaceomyces palustris TaxID=1673888 RepID=A0ACD0NSR2_9BASI|nr:BING4CT-domain-containing protein [Violaceomyces palustris]
MDPGPSSSSSPSVQNSQRSHARKNEVGKKRPSSSFHTQEALEKQADSIAASTRIPITFQNSIPASVKGAKPPKSLSGIKDKKLRSQMAKQHMSQKRALHARQLADEYLNHSIPGEEAGLIQTEQELERTYRVTQSQVRDNVGIETATKAFELNLDGGNGGHGLGPYRTDYTRNGRHLLIGGRKGHLAAFDWQSGKLSCEIHVRETVRDVCWLHDQSFFAAAQKKYAYIYDNRGIEIHKLKNHVEVQRMQFLPFHYLLATVGSSGYLKYQDTSTGNLVSQHRSALGSCKTMAQNPLTAVIHLGHANGTVTLWTPNLSTPALKLLAHRGPVTGISIDTRNGAREMATSGLDGSIKVWDSRMLGKGPRREWISRTPASEIAYSQRGLLGVGWGNHVSVYDTMATLGNAPPGPYLTHNIPGATPISLQFCPFEDVLGVGHSKGFTSLIIPGSGEPNYDTGEVDPFETKKRRREREVHSLLDKIQPEMISLDPTLLGSIDAKDPFKPDPLSLDGDGVRLIRPDSIVKSADGRSFSKLSRYEKLQLQGLDLEDGMDFVRSDEEDEDAVAAGEDEGRINLGSNAVRVGAGKKEKSKEKNKMRGKNSAMKKYLRKKKMNVIDPKTIELKERIERKKAQEKALERARLNNGRQEGSTSALDVFVTSQKRRR